MKELIYSHDKYKMNWIDGNTEWGTVKCEIPLDVEVKREKDSNIIKESYTFTNNTKKDIFTKLADIGIYTPFNDEYTTAAECMTNKCHTHIWCGGEVSYVMALRVGGYAPHLGMILTSGSLGGYSVERDISKMSNDRGDFIMHLSPFSLAPGEQHTISWTLFFHNGKDDFYKQASIYCKKFVDVRAEKYVLFQGEDSNVRIRSNFTFTKSDVKILFGNKPIKFEIEDNSVYFKVDTGLQGEINYSISISGVHTFLKLIVMPPFSELVRSRCRFIIKKQQYHNKNSHLDGAYLIYDNEEGSLFYADANDYNGGRERICMGILLALYLQSAQDDQAEKSLLKYIDYVKRELVDEDTGEVYNDYMRDNSYERLYNAPWFALFYIELYKLCKKQDYLHIAYKIIMYYYANGGEKFYPIELPSVQIIDCMKAENMISEAATLTEQFIRHADYICETGTNYPASEVNYEQSIVAPAADILLNIYSLTNEKKYLDAAEKQLEILELFNGSQPDYHLYEVAIRHWDGYWFGKKKLYGDTFPHYWSAITANVYYKYAKLVGNETYLKKAETAYRGVLSLFMSDGSASCAYVYPVSVNGEKAGFYDPYANDQDWGLYYMLKYGCKR